MNDRTPSPETAGVLAAGPSSVAPAEADREVRLPDGRRLTYNTYGDPGGRPVLYLHGFPGSRLEAGLTNAVAGRLGLCLVAPDRPGLGGSDPLPGRHMLDWAEDAGRLVDALGWGSFPVIGVSGGAPYALACAAGMPQRLTRVAVVAGMAPPDAPDGTRGMRWIGRLELFLARYWPAAAKPPLRLAVRATLKHPWGLPDWVTGAMPEADRRIMARPEVAMLYRSSVRESVRQGIDGAAWELTLLARPWGFWLDRLATPVSLWHGEADVTVPASMGHYMASRLPRCRSTFYPDEGHFSLPINHAWRILADLTSD